VSRLSIPVIIAATPAASQPMLEAVKKQLGGVSNLIRLVANSPSVQILQKSRSAS
jgi:hypothetical protein